MTKDELILKLKESITYYECLIEYVINNEESYIYETLYTVLNSVLTDVQKLDVDE